MTPRHARVLQFLILNKNYYQSSSPLEFASRDHKSWVASRKLHYVYKHIVYENTLAHLLVHSAFLRGHMKTSTKLLSTVLGKYTPQHF